jgi:endonuclease YncB( thermonuclease family)
MIMQAWRVCGAAVRRWSLLLLTTLAASAALGAQDAAPPIPRLDLEQTPLYPVGGVTDDCRITVRIDAEEHDVLLAGIHVPNDARARKRLRGFLESLLKAEVVAVQYVPLADDQLPEPPRAYLFRAPEGLFVNLEAVRQGQARVRAKPAGPHQELLRHYERRARQATKGIWAPTPKPERGRKSRAAMSQPAETSGEIVVYVTKSGTKYHREGCQYLKKSARAIPLEEAVERYAPCSRCKPPVLEKP